MHLIEELIRRYPGEWLAIEVKIEDGGQPKAGDLIYHAQNREEVWLKTKDRERLYIFYAGPPLKEGFAAAF